MAFGMGRKLFHGTRDEKVEAATAIVIWAAAFGFTLSTVTYYAQPFLPSMAANFNDDIAAVTGVVIGVLGGLKFSA